MEPIGFANPGLPLEFLNLFNADAREPFMEDPRGIRACLEQIKLRDLEFKMKVDKAHTVPYTVQIDQLQPEGVLLAFQRPLPPELARDALFLANFQMEGLNFQFPIRFQERKAYLRYLFTIPERIFKLERRKTPRLPFRPREKAEVNLRDDGVPGLGVSGPLLNLSREGVAIRVDRVLRLDNGLRLSVNSGHFPPAKFFGLVRLQGLPGLPQLDLRGFVVHATEKGGVLLLGLNFQHGDGDTGKLLADCLKLREKLLQVKSSGHSEPAGPGAGKAGSKPAPRPATLDAPASWDSLEVLTEAPPEEAEATDLDPLRQLLRRTLPLVINAPSPEAAEPLLLWLRSHGYWRLSLKGVGPQPPNAVSLETEPGFTPGTESLAVPPQDAWERDLRPQLDHLAGQRT